MPFDARKFDRCAAYLRLVLSRERLYQITSALVLMMKGLAWGSVFIWSSLTVFASYATGVDCYQLSIPFSSRWDLVSIIIRSSGLWQTGFYCATYISCYCVPDWAFISDFRYRVNPLVVRHFHLFSSRIGLGFGSNPSLGIPQLSEIYLCILCCSNFDLPGDSKKVV